MNNATRLFRAEAITGSIPAAHTRLAAWWDLRPSGYDAVNDRFTDQSGNGNHAVLGSSVGADTNDPLVRAYDATNGICIRHPGSSANYMSAPSTSVLSSLITDFTIDIQLDHDNWGPSADQTIVSIFNTSNLVWALRIRSGANAGKLTLLVSTNGTTSAGPSSSAAVPWGTGSSVGVKWIRAARTSSTGQIRFYTSTDGSTWTILGTAQTGTTGSLFSTSTAPIEIGSNNLGVSLPLSAFVYRVKLYSSDLGTSSGTALVDINPASQLGSEPWSTFTESGSSLTVTLNRSAAGRKLQVVDRGGSFFGTDDYLVVPDGSYLSFAHTQPFTVVIACRLTGTSADQVLMGKKADLTTGAGFALTRGTSNAEKFYVADGTTVNSIAGPAFTQGTACLIAGVRRPVSTAIASHNLSSTADNTNSTTETTIGTVGNALSFYIGSLNGSSNFVDMFAFRAGIATEYLSTAQLESLASEWLVAAT